MLSREIEVFRSVMTSGSATRAANTLGLTQPAVSLSIRRLEERAGIELFQRSGNKLQPTREAIALLAEVQRHFVGMDAIEHRLRTLARLKTNQVKIACFPGLGAGLIPRVLADLSVADSHELLSLQITSSQQVRELLLRGEVDFGFAARDVSVSGVEHALLAHYFGIVALPSGHPLAKFVSLTPQQIAEYPIIALPPDDAISMQLEAACLAKGVKLKTIIETSYTFSQCEMVRNSLGIAVVNPITAFDYRSSGLVFRPFSESIQFTALAIWPVGRPLSAFLRRMVSSIRVRLESDMKLLKADMPVEAREQELHRYHD